ncbi:DUF305 domain-containing protein [Nonomuraea cavernae]|uniref:Lipoprotein n=1 Tax=Nonomuraea cavernae TaxID=2045107 RepID=A0A917Z620_9ACTN|nr:DUF305 domain-containing protein [Nonomuraea cavernae]MCA2185747.1 DUF305 domain-containing protein [Nonomuraea cavernae]GGO75759.1 lipoprotein [Nonomuraea cavernae]
MRAALIVITGTVVALTSCSSTPPPAPRADSTVPVIAPGKPGEEARTLSPSEAATAVPSATANAADITYVQDMVVHHRQALDMAILAPNRAESTKLKGLASRIKDAQGPEIQYMTNWLQDLGQKVPGHHAAHDGMPGMVTPEQMEALKAAKGKAFDALFLQLMIAHHEGAIKMSTEVLTHGSHIRIEELASDVSVTQTAEIRRMREMQAAA